MSASFPLCFPSCSLKSKAEWQILQLYCWENYWNFCVCQHQEYWIRSQGQQGFQCKVLEMPEFTENKMFWKYDGNWRITVQKYSQTKRTNLTLLRLSTLLSSVHDQLKIEAISINKAEFSKLFDKESFCDNSFLVSWLFSWFMPCYWLYSKHV